MYLILLKRSLSNKLRVIILQVSDDMTTVDEQRAEIERKGLRYYCIECKDELFVFPSKTPALVKVRYVCLKHKTFVCRRCGQYHHPICDVKFDAELHEDWINGNKS